MDQHKAMNTQANNKNQQKIVQKIVAKAPPSKESSIIKSAAGTLLKQKIESKGDKDLIIKNTDKYVDSSRFCYLQSSSSSSSEKDIALGQMQKYKSTLTNQDVPEEATQEDQKSCGNDDTEVEGIKIPL